MDLKGSYDSRINNQKNVAFATEAVAKKLEREEELLMKRLQ